MNNLGSIQSSFLPLKPGLRGSDLELPAPLGVDPDGGLQVAEDRSEEGQAAGLRQRLVLARQQKESRIQVLIDQRTLTLIL